MLQIRTKDWISFAFPELTSINIRDMQSDMVARIKQESLLDNVKWVSEDTITHLEPMGYKDNALPARMLRYRADIWEYSLNHELGIPSIKQAVIIFLKAQDNEMHKLNDDRFSYSYQVIKVWEIDGNDITNKKLIGLYPLLPLTKQEETKKPHEIISSAIDVIDTITDPVLKADVLSAMSILAAEKYSKDLIKRYVRREQLMQSVLFQEWVADFVEEATEKAIEETQEKMAIAMLCEGDSIQKVVRISELSIKRVRELKKSLAESSTTE